VLGCACKAIAHSDAKDVWDEPADDADENGQFRHILLP
jgi:hypothetical protein